MSGAITHINYVSDDGNTYRVRMDAGNATAVGNAAASVTAHLPSGYVPRYILATHPTTGRERKLIIGAADNALFVSGTTVTIEEYAGTHSTAAAHPVLSRVGEKRYNRG